MNHRILLNFIILLSVTLVAALFIGPYSNSQAQTSNSFTYQGWLQNGTGYVNGTCSFDFSLFDAPSGGNQLATTVSKTDIAVTNGYFSVSLDFGSVFTSAVPRYLEVHNVNCGYPGDPIDLAGRVAIIPAIYARYAVTTNSADSVDWADITNKPADFADNSDDGVFMTCANNQTLHWAGGGWACTDVLNDHGALTGLNKDDHTQYLLTSGARAMTGPLNLAGNKINNVPQGSAAGHAVTYEQAVRVGTPIGGDLEGSYGLVMTVTQIQGRPVTNTVPITNQVFTWNGSQWAPADPQVGGSAGGDLDDTYPNPTVAGIQGRPIDGITPLDKQVLSWNGTNWQPTDAVSLNDIAGGDLGGTYPDPKVVGIQGRDVSSSLPGDNQVLTWNSIGNRWEAADPQTVGNAYGDLTGSYPNPTVRQLQRKPVSSSTPANKQVFTWNGSQWAPADITHLQGNPVLDIDPGFNQVLAWNNGSSQWAPAPITSLQGRNVAAGIPTDKQVLIWNGSEWAAADVLKQGDAVGGSDFSGNFPNPQLNPNTIGMAELNVPMGFGNGTGQFKDGDVAGDLFIIPSAAGFTPKDSGKCMVTVSAYIKNTASGTADDDPTIYLRTAKQVGTGAKVDDGGAAIWFAPDDVNSDKSIQASAGYVWPIDSADINQSVKFGCYVIDQGGDWDGDESVFCRVSYLCQ